MNRYFALYHGLHEQARWGVALERCEPHLPGVARVELLMLCRTEGAAEEFARLTNEYQALKAKRAEMVAAEAEMRTDE